MKNCHSSDKSWSAKHKSNLICFAMTLISTPLFWRWRKKENLKRKRLFSFHVPFNQTCLSYQLSLQCIFLRRWMLLWSCQFIHVSVVAIATDEQFPKSAFLLKINNFFLIVPSRSFFVWLVAGVFFFPKTFLVFLSFWLCLYTGSDVKDLVFSPNAG